VNQTLPEFKFVEKEIHWKKEKVRKKKGREEGTLRRNNAVCRYLNLNFHGYILLSPNEKR